MLVLSLEQDNYVYIIGINKHVNIIALNKQRGMKTGTRDETTKQLKLDR